MKSFHVESIKQGWRLARDVSIFLFAILQLYVYFIPYPFITIKGSIVVPIIVFIVIATYEMIRGYRRDNHLSSRHRDLLAGFGMLQNGKYRTRLPVQGNDELGLLEEGFNELAEQMNVQLRTLQRLVDQNVMMIKQAEQAAMTEERQKIARELHDAVSQQLFALSMLSSAAERTVLQNPERAVSIIQQISVLSVKTLNEMRALLLHLRPMDLQNKTLFVALSELLEELETRTDVKFDLKFPEESCLSQGSEEHVYRIVQEVLANCLRHAEATHVKILAELSSSQFVLTIRDDGRGFDSAKKKQTSYGLMTIRERCEEVGGTARLHSKEGEGTEWLFQIPCQPLKGGMRDETDSNWHNG
ncbi:histidine kinase [Paenisporosarcina sp. FSL H8-0542]|uniref:HAMP domain-containing sensor histidine kinase n=1 Tax=Paenisporosarcina sp. FSL H8-0542 TaxID=2921401 RepID=UPI00315A0F7F